jgi:hypothetical protein
MPLTELINLLAVLECDHGRHCADLKQTSNSGRLQELSLLAYLVFRGDFAVLVDVYGNKARRNGKQNAGPSQKGKAYSTFFCSATFLRIGVSILHGLHQLIAKVLGQRTEKPPQSFRASLT